MRLSGFPFSARIVRQEAESTQLRECTACAVEAYMELAPELASFFFCIITHSFTSLPFLLMLFNTPLIFL